jgi:hypothetical protein
MKPSTRKAADHHRHSTLGRVEAPAFLPDGKSLSYTQFDGAGFFMSAPTS